MRAISDIHPDVVVHCQMLFVHRLCVSGSKPVESCGARDCGLTVRYETESKWWISCCLCRHPVGVPDKISLIRRTRSPPKNHVSHIDLQMNSSNPSKATYGRKQMVRLVAYTVHTDD